MPMIARTRADVDVRSGPTIDASISDRFPGDCAVEMLEEKQQWYKVKPLRMMHTVSGYLPKPALAFPTANKAPVFPIISGVLTVPPSLKLREFQKWLTVGGKPTWIPVNFWSGVSLSQQANLFVKMLATIQADKLRWEKWLAELAASQRLEEAVMDEWIVIISGGRDLYAIRDHYIYKQPLQNELYLGCVLKGQVMRWTGIIRSGGQGANRKTFYDVEFYRMSRSMRGWFRADIAAPYLFPDAGIDPQVDANAETVFDLASPILRLPQDPEIADARSKGYTGAQYIDIFAATRKRLVHFSLCGEFCIATLGGMDVLPLLQRWMESKYPRAAAILDNPHEGTSMIDLRALLKCVDRHGEAYSSIPTSPQLIKNRLSSGQFVVSGCGINSVGKIKADGKIRHWVVIEDVRPVGSDGWVRVYNPFNNQDEVYSYNLFMQSAGAGGGMWVSQPGQAL